MNSTPLTFIVAHEDLARSLFAAVECILGKQQNVYTFTNKIDSLPVLTAKMVTLIEKQPELQVVCFTDLMGGSCWTLANMIHQKYPGMAVISGVNLPMLISYFNNCTDLPPVQLVEKTTNDGGRGIIAIQGSV